MMHCLLDQISYIEDLSDFSDSAQDLRWKICNYGYDLYLKTGKLVWALTQQLEHQLIGKGK